jgi:hypothetical protein
MGTDDGRDVAEALERCTDALSGDGVLVHDFPPGGVERAGFEEHAVGHGDFTDVMNDSAAAQGDRLFFGQCDFFPEQDRVARQQVAMAFSVRILRFDSARQARQHGLRVFELVRDAPQAHERAHARQELFFLYRLRQEIVRARLDALNAVFRATQSGDKLHGHQSCFWPRVDGGHTENRVRPRIITSTRATSTGCVQISRNASSPFETAITLYPITRNNSTCGSRISSLSSATRAFPCDIPLAGTSRPIESDAARRDWGVSRNDKSMEGMGRDPYSLQEE